jgi:hypothetical protein
VPFAAPAPPVAVIVPPPPFPVVNPPISPDAERRQRELAAFLKEIGPREQAVGGHVVARHHSNLSDQQLQDRLTKGLDKDGAHAPTSGVSSAFASDEIFQSTLRRVEELLNAGLESTRAYLRDNLDEYRRTRQAAEAAQIAALPNALGGANPLIAAHNQAKNDLLAAVGVTQHDNVIRSRFMLPVEAVRLPDIPGRIQWAGILKNFYVIRLFATYSIVAYHNRQVGRGFRGLQPVQKNVENKQKQSQLMTVYGSVQPFLAPADHTFTLLHVLGQHDLRMDRPHNARDWGVTTHFPADTRVESIRGA